MIDIDIKFIDNSKEVMKAINQAANESLEDSTKYLLRRANLTVPYDTGKLRRSGKRGVNKSKKEGVVSYDTDYAVRVHESVGRRYNQKGRSSTSKNKRRAKWLEYTAKEAVQDGKLKKRISKIFKRYL